MTDILKRTGLAAISIAFALIQVPSAVFAATDQEVYGAAQAGIAYLAANQSGDGSISGFGSETEWSVIALATAGRDATATALPGGASAVDFMTGAHPDATTPATTVEREILAITAAGGDPRAFGGFDYSAELLSRHVSSQIGDPTLLNDDIFGVMVSAVTADPALYTMAQDGLSYLLAHQTADGGFSYTTDTCAFCGADSNDTAAAILALYAAENIGLAHPDLAASRDAAIAFLLSTQQSDGGFGYDAASASDGSSTAWALMALNMVGAAVATQAEQARDWLLDNQNADGGFSFGAFGLVDSSTSVTPHAVIALLGSTWLLSPEPMNEPKPTPPPAEQPVEPKTSSTFTSAAQPVQPAEREAAAPTVFASSVQTPAEQALGEEETPQTKAAQSDMGDSAQPAKDKKESGGPNYALFGLGTLSLIALGWFMLQSRKQQEGK